LRARRISSEVGGIEESAGANGREAKEPGQLAQTLDIRDVANAPLQNRGDVGPKPSLAARTGGSRDDFGITALDDALG